MTIPDRQGGHTLALPTPWQAVKNLGSAYGRVRRRFWYWLAAAVYAHAKGVDFYYYTRREAFHHFGRTTITDIQPEARRNRDAGEQSPAT